MKEYKSRFKSYNIERIVNRQTHLLRPELVAFVARTSNGKAIDYTHTIDINFEERRHKIVRKKTNLRNYETSSVPIFRSIICIISAFIGTINSNEWIK